ncbi:hypothetical protein SeLEV6574_g07129 [Synchytrium endobioticum]|uniref:Defective in cullin neddylation protein n=1 Tax=Synchytrium endobioticum TaxID=286115 RepID=A0A507CM32_9FUNG|nr:hypothetical protein SeLEV6574_g07129 [Synchytrium endobioticum]
MPKRKGATTRTAPKAATAAANKRAKAAAIAAEYARVDTPASATLSKKVPPTDSLETAKWNSTTCSKWFDHYRDDHDPSLIGPDGIIRHASSVLCQELDVSPESVQVLMFAYKLQARRMGFFQKDAWMSGMQKLDCDSNAKLKKKLPMLAKEIDDPDAFKRLYQWTFEWAKATDAVTPPKCLDVDIATSLWKLMMTSPRFHHVDSFLKYLQVMRPVKVVNKDQWTNWLEFSKSIDHSLEGYDSHSAWPTLLDNYVEWYKVPVGS